MATFIFDFDDTLFDTKKFVGDLSNELIRNGVNSEIIRQSYQELKNKYGNYDLLTHIEILKNQYYIHNLEVVYDWFNSVDFSSYIFPEVIDLLDKLSKDNHLILLTKGEVEFQSVKVKGSNISKYFNEVHITPSHKEVFLKDKEFNYPVYFINDKESENEKIRSRFPSFNISEDFRILKKAK